MTRRNAMNTAQSWYQHLRDWLLGGTGDDHLFDGTGADVLVGGEGDDTLTGDSRSDSLFGGTGSDTFYVPFLPSLGFQWPRHSGADRDGDSDYDPLEDSLRVW